MYADDMPLELRIFSGERIKVLVMGRREVREASINVPYIVISLTDPGSLDAEIADSPLCRATLRLKFHDIGDYGQPLRDNVVMTEDDARSILTFVQEHLNDADLILCHCEAGVSRSAGVAAALSRLLNGEDEFFFANYWPNRWVYKSILDMAETNGWNGHGKDQ